MPDPTKKTVSATQVAALFNVSKWDTRWTLYKRFCGEGPPDFQDARMSWGQKMQPLVLEQAAEDLKLSVAATNHYTHRGVIGCTRDAVVFCPDRGPGSLETKCVFDYAQWMRAWGGGECVPVDYEMQLQAQMFVGTDCSPDEPDRAERAYSWGVIAAWVCGDMYYFERRPDMEFWREMVFQAKIFLDQVAGGDDSPDPMGDPLELPTIAATWGQVVPKKEIDLSAFEDALPISEAARMYDHAAAQRKFWAKTEESQKAKLLAASQDAAKLILPRGVYVDIGKSQTKAKVVQPEDVGTVARKASVRTSLKISIMEQGPGDVPDAPVFG